MKIINLYVVGILIGIVFGVIYTSHMIENLIKTDKKFKTLSGKCYICTEIK